MWFMLFNRLRNIIMDNTTTSNSSKRYYSLDLLRVVMTLLGIPLHAAISYMNYLPSRSWDSDIETHYLFDVLFGYIHLFRIPSFFLIAGFFGAMLMERKGLQEFLKNRGQRILVPLLICWVGIMVLSGQYPTKQLGHIWYLYYLILFYLVDLVISRMVSIKQLPTVNHWFRQSLILPYGILFWMVLTSLTNLTTPFGYVMQNTTLVQQLHVWVCYLLFYGFGKLLYFNKDLIFQFKQYGISALAVSIPIMALNYWIYLTYLQDATIEWLPFLGVCITSSIICWLVIFGTIGTIMQYYKPSRIIRYLADASYFIYIIHVPITIYISIKFTGIEIPSLVKFLINNILTFVIVVVLYNYLARNTAIGWLLNGRRYKRGLPPE